MHTGCHQKSISRPLLRLCSWTNIVICHSYLYNTPPTHSLYQYPLSFPGSTHCYIPKLPKHLSQSCSSFFLSRCYSDVLHYMDSQCSGRQKCKILIATLEAVAQPCQKDFKSYLQATFRCVKGTWFFKYIIKGGICNYRGQSKEQEVWGM